MTKKTKKKFTIGISYEENLIGLEETYRKEVLPFVKENKEAYKRHLESNKEIVLSASQKAQLNCKSPI